MPLIRSLALSFVVVAALASAACQGAHNNAAAAPTAGPTKVATSCQAADLALPDGHVVARVDGKDLTAKELGAELRDQEKAALAEYCARISDVRRQALDNKVREMVVDRAAAAEQQTAEQYLKAKVDAAVGEPTDEEVQKFFSERAPPDAPPIDLIRPQVVEAVKREKMGAAFEKLLASLEKDVKVERMLPDVRPPAVEIGVEPHTPVAGAEKPVVEVIEFADFECPYCKVMAETISGLKKEFEGKAVRFSYRHFPLSFHPSARPAAEMAQCANEQGKFWELHDAIYTSGEKIDVASLRAQATTVGLDMQKIDECLASERPKTQVDTDFARGQAIGVEGTPSLYINGRAFQGRPSPEGIAEAIRAELSAGS